MRGINNTHEVNKFVGEARSAAAAAKEKTKKLEAKNASKDSCYVYTFGGMK